MKFDLSKIHITGNVKYRAIFLSAGAVHIFFFAFFLMIQYYPMVIYNVFSILMYILGGFFSVAKNYDNIRYGWILAVYVEIMTHAVLATLVMGWDPSFHLYSIAVIPVVAYMLFMTNSVPRFVFTMGAMIIVDVLAIGSTMWYLSYYESFIQVSERFIRPISYINAFFSCAIVLVFTLLFIAEVASMLTKLDNANKNLEYIATHDALTGLYNRHSLKKLYSEIEKSDEPFCVVLGDIDDFKKVNDTFGHDYGDIVLKSVAEIISRNIGEKDTACRWGGEEMLIVMKGERESCFDVISVIKDEISEMDVLPSGSHARVTMTFGFVYRSEERGVESLIAVADSRLYIGKRSGKNVIVTESENG